ncbi:hypothetical protein ACJD0Z_17945 [Flavobacteriaceae bacterium M23B6Z8]
MNFSIKELQRLSRSDQRKIVGGSGSYCSGSCCTPFSYGISYHQQVCSGSGSGGSGGSGGGGGGGGGYPY